MKKNVLGMVLCFVFFLSIFSNANAVSVLADPNTNVANPRSLPYTASVSNFNTYTTTYSIAGSSDGSITVNVRDAYLGLSGNKTAKVTVRVYYRNSNGYWVKGNAKSINVTTSATNYAVSLTLPTNTVFYVRLSKSSYADYKIYSNLYITD